MRSVVSHVPDGSTDPSSHQGPRSRWGDERFKLVSIVKIWIEPSLPRSARFKNRGHARVDCGYVIICLGGHDRTRHDGSRSRSSFARGVPDVPQPCEGKWVAISSPEQVRLTHLSGGGLPLEIAVSWDETSSRSKCASKRRFGRNAFCAGVSGVCAKGEPFCPCGNETPSVERELSCSGVVGSNRWNTRGRRHIP